ncbi:MAG: pyridoxal phosphate-dependent aminotransferase [Deltaproteobacteria bacterium]|nr:MAG: pyridoxal phosphate-dependent aminotransferase [Deltaproteobacteria bacterium]
MSVSEKIRSSIERASWIRRMFEEGALRKARYGPENVFDFSLGNPNLEPPAKVKEILRELVSNSSSGMHGYMHNAGFVKTREAVATYLSNRDSISFGPEDIVMTAGAGGALNVVLKTILNPGDEIIIPAPYFAEYNFYLDNYDGIPKTVDTNPDFSLNLLTIEEAISPSTKAVLINNPNNPTGRVYIKDELSQLGKLLTLYSQRYGRPIYLISDEPYRKIIYDGLICPSIFDVYTDSFLVTSFSKDLSLAGERIGYIASHPLIADKDIIVEGLILCNRILGFVNAPALMQRLIPFLLADSVDVALYQQKRDTLCKGLEAAGYRFTMPGGAFYLFPETPIPDDVEFVSSLQDENILTVPGSGFGGPGHFRIAYCVADETIERALPGFARVMERYR